MLKILCQTDYQGYFVELTYNNFTGAIDIEAPNFNKETEKAKWNGLGWIIKPIVEWEQEEKDLLESQKREHEKQLVIQKEIDEAKKITDFYEMAEILGVKFI